MEVMARQREQEVNQLGMDLQFDDCPNRASHGMS
jgi:hypothetical protein